MTRLSREAENVLRSLSAGKTLKAQRYLDGRKIYLLYTVQGEVVQEIAPATVDLLKDSGYITSNMKFPAATYVLTDSGYNAAGRLGSTQFRPLTARYPDAAS